MSKFNIPPAALEAGARAALTAAFQIEPDARVHELTMDEYASIARAAFEAMVNNWDGMEYHPTHAGYPAWPHLILPLPPQENENG